MGKEERDDDIPSVRELEALEEQERKETKDLLAGFDRPGRTPRRVRGGGDFVDYYSGRSAPVRAPAKREETSPHEEPTVVVPRSTGFRGTILWAVAVSGMILFGAAIAILATPDAPLAPPPSASPSMPTMTPTSATTITSANPRPVEETTTDTVIVAPSPKKAAPSTTVTGASSAPTIKTAPRDDFIRDL